MNHLTIYIIHRLFYVRAGKLKVFPRSLNCLFFFIRSYLFIINLETVHLTPHIGTIKLVKREQGIDIFLSGQL